MIKIAILGYGYWGPNLLRNFSQIENCLVKTVADLRPERLNLAKKLYPSLTVTTSIDDVINDSEIDAVIIATPVFSHYTLGKQALLKDKHVLIEKPMTTDVNHAMELIDLALKKNRVLMVDHTFLYTGAVKKIKEVIGYGIIGNLQYFDSVRINLGLFNSEVNVIWDLAPHDISILFDLYKKKPESVIATGVSHTENGIENIAYITLNYSTSMVAHFTCSWSSPVKVRKIMVGGSKKMIVYDDVEPTEKVKIYDTGYSYSATTGDEDKHNILVDYRLGNIFVPRLGQEEALRGVALDFFDAITKGTEPISNCENGLNVVRVLDAAQKSISKKGKEIKI